VLPIFFAVQFSFLYSGYKNEAGVNDLKNGLGLLFIGGLIFVAFAAVAADAGLFVAFGIETASGIFEGGGLLEALQSALPSFDGIL
jgi:zeaxanthin epoxidase